MLEIIEGKMDWELLEDGLAAEPSQKKRKKG